MSRLTVIGAVVAVLVVWMPEAADAHVSSVSATAACEPDGSSQLVTWTILNEYSDPATLTKLKLSPAVDGLELPTAVVAERDHRPGAVTFSYRIPVGAKQITIEYVGVWPDHFSKTFHGGTTGVASCPNHTPVPPTSAPTLPVTGIKVTTIVGVAGAFLALGGVLVLVGRRARGAVV